MKPQSSQRRLMPGDRLDQFTIQTQLGQGENALVYRASHPAYEHAVAIKVFHPDVTRTESLTPLFTTQVSEIAVLRHPNIMRVLDSGVTGDSYYIVMQLIEGTTLRDKVSTHPRGFDRETALSLFQQIASAIAYAHDQNIIHGNIKPDNVLLDQNGRPVLTDFNIPAFREHPSGRGGAATPAYLAPEQAAQDLVTVRTDVFALGVLLYEMITGDVPFKAATRDAIIQQHRSATPKPPSQLRVGIDPRIEKAVMTALKREPTDRFDSVRDMISSLQTESTSDPYETIALTRQDMAEVQKRQADIKRFERSRAATSNTGSSRLGPIKSRALVIGLIILALIAVVIATVDALQ